MPKSSGLTPSERRLRASLAGHASWANTEDRTARTEPGRRAMWEKFYDQVDPERKLASSERHKRAVNARKAHFQRLALKSAKARRLAKEARQVRTFLSNGEITPTTESPVRGQGPPGGQDGEGRATPGPANVEKVVTTPPITNTRKPSPPRRQYIPETRWPQ